MIEVSEIVKVTAMTYEFIGMATIILFVKILDVASDMIGEGEIADMNRQLKQFLGELTPVKKLLWFILASLVWLPAVIFVLIKLRDDSSD